MVVVVQCCRVWSTTSKLLPQEGWLVVVVGRNHRRTITSSKITRRRLTTSALVAHQIHFGSSRPLAFTVGLLLPIGCCSAVEKNVVAQQHLEQAHEAELVVVVVQQKNQSTTTSERKKHRGDRGCEKLRSDIFYRFWNPDCFKDQPSFDSTLSSGIFVFRKKNQNSVMDTT